LPHVKDLSKSAPSFPIFNASLSNQRMNAV
jgi:hypothetical protein